MPLGLESEAMIVAAQKARVAHLTKLTETGMFNRGDGNIVMHSAFQFLADLTQAGKNEEFFYCRKCGLFAPNHLSHNGKGQYRMKHHLRCSLCNTEYFSWVRDGHLCMRL